MKALVTGGAGYIGSHLCHLLVSEGVEVVVFDDFSTGVRENIPTGCTVHEGDLCDGESVRRCFDEHPVEIVYHLAAKILPDESIRNPLKYYENNTVATAGLIREARRSGVSRFLFASTAAVYGNPDGELTGEEAIPIPVSPYGKSKLYSEGMLLDLDGDEFAVGILRFFNVAGVEPGVRVVRREQPTHLISRILDIVREGSGKLTVFGDDYETRDGTPIRDYIHVQDLALALKAVGEGLRDSNHSVFNVGYGKGYSVLEVVRSAERVFGRSIPWEIGERRQGDISHMVSDCTRLREEVPWSPRYESLEDIFRSYTREG